LRNELTDRLGPLPLAAGMLLVLADWLSEPTAGFGGIREPAHEVEGSQAFSEEVHAGHAPPLPIPTASSAPLRARTTSGSEDIGVAIATIGAGSTAAGRSAPMRTPSGLMVDGSTDLVVMPGEAAAGSGRPGTRTSRRISSGTRRSCSFREGLGAKTSCRQGRGTPAFVGGTAQHPGFEGIFGLASHRSAGAIRRSGGSCSDPTGSARPPRRGSTGPLVNAPFVSEEASVGIDVMSG
jgi:hypothetical protein